MTSSTPVSPRTQEPQIAQTQRPLSQRTQDIFASRQTQQLNTPPLPSSQGYATLAPELPLPILPALSSKQLYVQESTEEIEGSPWDSSPRYKQNSYDDEQEIVWGRDHSRNNREMKYNKKSGRTLIPKNDRIPFAMRKYTPQWTQYYLRERKVRIFEDNKKAIIPFDLNCCNRENGLGKV
jgi:hypothetical protein